MLVGSRDVFLIQPTGPGKSSIFQSAAIFFDIVRPKFVISPLVSLILDQVRFLKSLGISAEIIGDEQNCEQAVYGFIQRFLQF